MKWNDYAQNQYSWFYKINFQIGGKQIKLFGPKHGMKWVKF